MHCVTLATPKPTVAPKICNSAEPKKIRAVRGSGEEVANAPRLCSLAVQSHKKNTMKLLVLSLASTASFAFVATSHRTTVQSTLLLRKATVDDVTQVGLDLVPPPTLQDMFDKTTTYYEENVQKTYG